MASKKKDKVGKGKGGEAATNLNKTIRGGVRSIVGFADSLLGSGPKRKGKKK